MRRLKDRGFLRGKINSPVLAVKTKNLATIR